MMIFPYMSTGHFHIIEAHPADVDILLYLSRKIFDESFHALNTTENMLAYMDQAYNREQLNKELLDGNSEHYFICDHEQKVGFLKINWAPAQSDIRDPESLEVQRIYVDGAYQNKGLGALLLEKAMQRAREMGMKYVWLGVWEKNPHAIRFYQRHGFEIFGTHPFVMGDEVQTDILMRQFIIN
jgi:ribosomal protein S18 acetylase RimI-like enzyme